MFALALSRPSALALFFLLLTIQDKGRDKHIFLENKCVHVDLKLQALCFKFHPSLAADKILVIIEVIP